MFTILLSQSFLLILMIVCFIFAIIIIPFALAISLYLLIVFIWKVLYDPKPLKRNIKYHIIDSIPIKINNKIKYVSNYLIKHGYSKQYVDISGFSTQVFYKKEIINEFKNDPLIKKIPFARPSNLNMSFNIFYFIVEIDYVKQKDIVNFSEHCCAYSIQHMKGLPRGLWSGVMSISVITSENIDKEAIGWVEQQPPKHFAAAEIPVIFDLIKNIPYHYDNSQFWGSKIYPWSIDLINKSLNTKNPSYNITNSIIDSLKHNM